MGTWGTAIYSTDIASDVRVTCREVFAFYEVEEGNNIIFLKYKEILEQGYVDNEYASFWYALADWQWKHGMLTDDIRNKTLEFLEDYAGIDEWIEDGNLKDAEKRKKVLDALKEQLISPQPQYKKPKASVKRPKHKPGDIIVFRPSMEPGTDGWRSVWEIDDLSWPHAHDSQVFLEAPYKDIPCCDARGKYLAILCIGSVKEQYSQYVDNVFDEYSLYVWYDYLSDAKPTAHELKSCGFLPSILVEWKDYNKRITESVNWIYTFTLYCESFRVGRSINEFSKFQDITEVERFYSLFSHKNYSSAYRGTFELYTMYGTAFEEKIRASLIHEQIDNLLNISATNPQLASPAKLDQQRKKFLEKEKTQY